MLHSRLPFILLGKKGDINDFMNLCTNTRSSYTQGLSLVGDLQGQIVAQLLAVMQQEKNK